MMDYTIKVIFILSEKLFTLDLTSLSQGIYTIQLITNTGVVNHSILKK